MKLKTFLILLLVIISAACSGKRERNIKPLNIPSHQVVTPEIKEEYLMSKNKVKSRTTTTYFYNQTGKRSKQGDIVDELLFDEYGNKAVQLRYAGGGIIDLQFEWHYNDNDQVISSKTTDPGGKVFYSRESEYDDNGNEIRRMERELKSRDDMEILYTYNDSGFLEKVMKREKRGKIIANEYYHYKDSNLVNIEIFNLNGVKTNERFFEYDSLGRITKITKKELPNFESFEKFSYDKNGNLTVYDEVYFKRVYEYDENNFLITETAYDKDGYQQQKLIFTNNSMGLPVSRIKTDGEDIPIIYTEYEYEFFD